MTEQTNPADMRPMLQEMNAAFAAFKAKYDDKVAFLESGVTELATKLACGHDFGKPAASRVIADALSGDALRSLRDGSTDNALLPLEASIKDIRAIATNDGFGSPAQYDPRIANIAQPRLSLLDLLPSIAVMASTFKFNQVTTDFANAADYQATEGSAKPNQEYPAAIVDSPIATIAAYTGLSEQVIDDVPTLQAQVGNLLVYGVRQKLEGQVIAGTAGSGKITGLLNAGTAFAAAEGATGEDAISECAAHLQSLGWNPSAIAISPTDWHTMRISKASGSGEYMAGSWNQAPIPNLWGVPVVVSRSVPAGKAVVLDTAQAALLDRMQVRLQFGYIADDFAKNIVRLRAELRAGLAVFAPTAVQIVTFA